MRTLPAEIFKAYDIRGIVGIIPTPSTPDADRWDCENSVDAESTRAMVERIVAGLDLPTTGRVLLDDAARPGERVVARRWRKEHQNMDFTLDSQGAKGTLLGHKHPA